MNPNAANITISSIDDSSNESSLIKEALKYEKAVTEILKEFSKISDDYLLARDMCSIQNFDFFHSQKEEQLKKVLIKDPLVKTIDTVYDWTSLRLKNLASEREMQFSLCDSVTIACIPELFFSKYREILLEELDYNRLFLLEKATTLSDLLEQLKECFEQEDIQSNFDNFYQLVMLKLKSLIVNKCIQVVENDHCEERSNSLHD